MNERGTAFISRRNTQKRSFYSVCSHSIICIHKALWFTSVSPWEKNVFAYRPVIHLEGCRRTVNCAQPSLYLLAIIIIIIKKVVHLWIKKSNHRTLKVCCHLINLVSLTLAYLIVVLSVIKKNNRKKKTFFFNKACSSNQEMFPFLT